MEKPPKASIRDTVWLLAGTAVLLLVFIAVLMPKSLAVSDAETWVQNARQLQDPELQINYFSVAAKNMERAEDLTTVLYALMIAFLVLTLFLCMRVLLKLRRLPREVEPAPSG